MRRTMAAAARPRRPLVLGSTQPASSAATTRYPSLRVASARVTALGRTVGVPAGAPTGRGAGARRVQCRTAQARKPGSAGGGRWDRRGT